MKREIGKSFLGQGGYAFHCDLTFHSSHLWYTVRNNGKILGDYRLLLQLLCFFPKVESAQSTRSTNVISPYQIKTLVLPYDKTPRPNMESKNDSRVVYVRVATMTDEELYCWEHYVTQWWQWWDPYSVQGFRDLLVMAAGIGPYLDESQYYSKNHIHDDKEIGSIHVSRAKDIYCVVAVEGAVNAEHAQRALSEISFLFNRAEPVPKNFNVNELWKDCKQSDTIQLVQSDLAEVHRTMQRTLTALIERDFRLKQLQEKAEALNGQSEALFKQVSIGATYPCSFLNKL